MPGLDLDLSENAAVNSERAAMISALASGHLPPAPVVIPSVPVSEPEIYHARFEPAPDALRPWRSRLLAEERNVDMAEARAELRAAIAARAAAAAVVAAVADELERADTMLTEIQSAQAEHAENGSRQIANLADRLRDWIAVGSPGDRPACGSVRLPGPRDEAELEAARMARADVASDHDRAHAAHALAVQAVDRSRCLVLTAEAQAIAARYEAVLGVLAELQADGRALLGLTLSGTPALAGLVRERLPASLAPAGGDDAAARWTAFLARLDDDPDAELP